MNFLALVWMVTGIVAVLRKDPFKGFAETQGWDAIGFLLGVLAGGFMCAILGPFAFLVIAVNEDEK